MPPRDRLPSEFARLDTVLDLVLGSLFALEDPLEDHAVGGVLESLVLAMRWIEPDFMLDLGESNPFRSGFVATSKPILIPDKELPISHWSPPTSDFMEFLVQL